MSKRELELMQGMVNCYHTCHGDFEETVSMVGSARGLSPEEVKETLRHLEQVGGEEYNTLRSRLPKDFPL